MKTALSTCLYKRKYTVKEACQILNIPYSEDLLKTLEVCECSNCSIWYKPKELKNDLDGNPTCDICLAYYGM